MKIFFLYFLAYVGLKNYKNNIKEATYKKNIRLIFFIRKFPKKQISKLCDKLADKQIISN